MAQSMAEHAAETISKGIGRRGFIRAVAAMSAGAGLATTAACSTTSTTTAAASSSAPAPVGILQPGAGDISGDHYLSSEVDKVLWGYVPTVESESVLQMKSGETVTIDALSHEGILED